MKDSDLKKFQNVYKIWNDVDQIYPLSYNPMNNRFECNSAWIGSSNIDVVNKIAKILKYDWVHHHDGSLIFYKWLS